MPALPSLLRAATTANTDSRTLDARGITNAVERIAQSISTHDEGLLRRAASILARQSVEDSDRNLCSNGYIAACYQGLRAGPAPGAVVGIVLGSIAGFFFILWILWILSTGSSFIQTTTLREEEVDTSRRRSRSPRSRRSHRSTYQSEMRHTSPRRDRIIRQERVVRDVPPPRMESSRVRETVIMEESRGERRVDGDDIIEVVEEHSSISGAPPPRRKSRKSSGYR